MPPRASITIDCRDPQVLVAFWCEVLGYIPEPPPRGHASWLAYWRAIGIPETELEVADHGTCDSIVDPRGVGPRIWFQVVPEAKVHKNRVHLDVDVTDGRTGSRDDRQAVVDEVASRLIGMGAQHLRTLAPSGADYYAVTLADPEGNEFCLS
ncbi:MAG: hypothetical protein RL347_802 [Actinomycetota bacterium]|jgi:hypothetical protein